MVKHQVALQPSWAAQVAVITWTRTPEALLSPTTSFWASDVSPLRDFLFPDVFSSVTLLL